MGYSLQLRLKDGTYQDVALAAEDAGSLLQQWEDEERRAAFDDLALELDNTDGFWTSLFSAANLNPTDAYPSRFGFRVLKEGVPYWEGDLDYESVEHKEETATIECRVVDGLKRLEAHNAENLKRDYSSIAIVSGARHSKELQVNNVLDGNGEPLAEDDEIELAHVKPNTKIGKQTLKVKSVDALTNTITFKRRLRYNYDSGDVILVKNPWYRGKTVSWLLDALLDLVPGYDASHRVLDYDGTTWSDIVDIADFSGKDVGSVVQLLADWVNAQIFHRLNTIYIVGRGRAVGSQVKALDALVGEGVSQPVGQRRYDLVKIKGRDGRYVRKGVLPFGGNKLEVEFPFSRDRARLQQVADRYWDYWGRVRATLPELPVADDGTAYTCGSRVAVGGTEYQANKVAEDLDESGYLSLDLIALEGTLPDPGEYDQDDLVDDDEDPPEPTSFVFTKDYSTTFNSLFPSDKYPRLTTTREQVGTAFGEPVFQEKLWRLYELHWAYPYDELGAGVWRFQITVWPDGKDREKPHVVFTVPADQQADGLYYAKVRLPAGKLWWADAIAILEDLRESAPSDENSSSSEDDIVGTPHFYSAEARAELILRADTRPIVPGAAAAHYYYAEVDATTWLDARPDGTRQLHRYTASVSATLWLDADARPLALSKAHYYAAEVDATTWLDARPDGTRQLHRYTASVSATLWISSTTDVGDPGGTGLTMTLTSYEDDAPGTAAKECDLTATLAGSAIVADRVIFHATRNGSPLPAVRVDIDQGATSVVAHWPRCAKAGDTLVVTAVKLRIHHKKTALSGVSGGPPWTVAAGASTYGGSGVPSALPAPTLTAVSGTGGPHTFEVDISWAGLTAAEKARLYKVRVWVYHGAWVEKEPVDVRQMVLAGATSCRVKVHVAKKLTAGASNYPNVKACLRDYYQQNGTMGYLYGSGDGTTVSDVPQVAPLEFFETDNGYLRALQLELTDSPSSPTLAQALANMLKATSSKLYFDGTYTIPRRVVVRDGTNFKLPAGTELFNGLILPAWNAAGSSPGWFNLLVYFPRYMGLSAYSSSTSYMAGDYCYSGTTVYRSKVDNNTGNSLSNTTYWANVGSLPAANKWARFSAAGTLADDGVSDPVDPTSTSDPPAGGGGCFTGEVYVLTADWTGVSLQELWEAQCHLGDPEFGIPIMGFDLQARDWAVTGALQVLRHAGKFWLVDSMGLAVTPDHLLGIADPELGEPSMGAVRWKAAGRLAGDYVVALDGKRCRLIQAPQDLPEPVGSASEVFNMRTGTGNYWVSSTPEGPWVLAHNLKGSL
jgi:hypothetical protein